MAKPIKKTNQTMDSKASMPLGYETVLQEVKSLILTAQLKAMKAVNQALVFTYRGIGETLHKQQQSADWGSFVVEQLARDLQQAFPGMKARCSTF